MKKFFSTKRKELKSVQETFSQYIPADRLKEILSAQDRKNSDEMQRCPISFILLQIKDERMDDLKDMLSKVTEVLCKNNGFITGIISNTILAIFGFPPENDQNSVVDLENVVTSLLKAVEENVRLVYGKKEGLLGNFGTAERLYYGPIFKNFDDVLLALRKVDYGEALKL